MAHLRLVPDRLDLGAHESQNKSWQAAITEYLVYLQAGGYPQTTIYTRRQHLEHAARRIEVTPFAVTSDTLITYFSQQEWKPETRRGRRASFKHFYAHAMMRGHTFTNPADALPVIKPAPATPRPAPDEVFLAALFKASPRERLMIRLAGELGLRRAEVAVGHSSDIVLSGYAYSLTVHGKGGKVRVLPLPDGLAAALRALPPGYFFPGNDDGHLSPRYVGKLIAALMPDGWTMHTLRHRCATRAWNLDHDLLTVQALMGHASPATTQRYIAQSDDVLRSMVNRLAG